MIGGGYVGTAQTIRQMQKLATHGKRDFRIRKLAISLVRNCPNKDYNCFARAIYNYCTHQIKYIFDPNGVELIENPWRIVESGGADCDSIVVLLAAMLESIGFPCEYVTIKADGLRPNEFSHVYLECDVPKTGWVSMDCTMPDKSYGWKPAPEFPRKRWPASKDSPERREGDRMAGLGLQVPHVEHTVGVAVGNPWNFRPEAAIVTSTPEELELETLNNPAKPMLAPHPEFYTRDQLRARGMAGLGDDVDLAKVPAPVAGVALMVAVVLLAWMAK